MNLWMSLLLYNPLEAFVLLWACHSFNPTTKNQKFNFVKNIKHFYILGAIFLAIQYIPFALPELSNSNSFGTIMSLVLNLLVILISNFVAPSIILYYYTLKKYKLVFCFSVFVVYFLSLLLLINIFNLSMFKNEEFYFELIYNLLIKTIQIIIIFVLRGLYAKKYSKASIKK